MKGQELESIRSKIQAGSKEYKKVFLNSIEPVIREFTNDKGRNTPRAKRRARIMKKMALEIIYNGYCPGEESAENFLSKFFSEIYSKH